MVLTMNTSIQRIENLKIVQKRRAIREALEPFMDAALLSSTLHLWEEKYSHMPTFALQHFLREICENKLLLPQRSGMLQALIRSLSALPDDVLEPVKQPTHEAKAAVYAKREKGHSPEMLMFMDLVEELIAFMGRDYQAKIRVYIMENLEKADISTHKRWALHSWIKQTEPLKDIDLDVRSMQQVINLVYIALCEYLGPVKADFVLHSVLAGVQTRHPGMSVNKLL